MNDILKRHEGQVLTLILNRPDKHNCINMDMLNALDTELISVDNDPEIRAVVIRGAGDRSFSSGGDLKAFHALDRREIVTWIRRGNEVFNRLEALSKPTLAAIHGYCYGGGLELALACDFRVATTGASFGSPELKHGWLPGWGGMARLRRLAGEAHAKEIILLADNITGEDAFRFGLLTRLVAPSALEATVSELVRNLCTIDTRVLSFAKSVIQDPASGTSGADISFDILGTYYSKAMEEEE